MDIKTMTLDKILTLTNWTLLAEQKLALLEAIKTLTPDMAEPLQGLLHWIDAIQDTAAAEGFRVVFLTDEESR